MGSHPYSSLADESWSFLQVSFVSFFFFLFQWVPGLPGIFFAFNISESLFQVRFRGISFSFKMGAFILFVFRNMGV